MRADLEKEKKVSRDLRGELSAVRSAHASGDPGAQARSGLRAEGSPSPSLTSVTSGTLAPSGGAAEEAAALVARAAAGEEDLACRLS